MKYNHLPRQSQQQPFITAAPTNGSVGSQVDHQTNAADLLMKQHHQQQLAAAAAAANFQQHLHNQLNLSRQRHQQSYSDNEEEDESTFEHHQNQESFYAEQLMRQQHQLASAAAAAAAAASGQQSNAGPAANQSDLMQSGNDSNDPDDNSNYLMDKNKKLFPQKLWELIHNPNIQHCLRWSQDGQRVYLNRQEFEQYYLKTANNQFHTQKAISFVRQMNMYGFRKVDDCYYENDNFRRDSKHLLKNMIRRHPNKGLFVGLVDHHQLNAAAAAAAAAARLQVNHQLQQQLVQDHHLQQQNCQKQQQAAVVAHHQRAAAAAAEQALRLNNYLNSTTQHHQQLQSHLAAAAAVAHQHQQQQHLKHSIDQQQQGENLTISNIRNQQQKHISQHQSSAPDQLKDKKSRLLNNFYGQDRSVEDDHQWSHLNRENSHQQVSRKGSIDQYDSAIGSNGDGPNSSANADQFNSRSHAARQTALHETLVRSLLQLKHHGVGSHVDANDLLANLTSHQQSQQQRSLLESLASLSSAGTGSIVDPASNSPTERTATPPSRSPSPSLDEASCSSINETNDSIALNLARSSKNNPRSNTNDDGNCMEGSEDREGLRGGECERDEDEEEETSRVNELAEAAAGSPLDGQKKVRKFLEDQMMNSIPMSLTIDNHQNKDGSPKRENIDQQLWECPRVKRDHGCTNEQEGNNQDESVVTSHLPQKKRFKNFVVDTDVDDPTIRLESKSSTLFASRESLAKSFVLQVCDQNLTGDCDQENAELFNEKLQLGEEALVKAAEICQHFMQILIHDAAKLAAKSYPGDDETEKKSEPSRNDENLSRQVIDINAQDLIAALERVPSKLMIKVGPVPFERKGNQEKVNSDDLKIDDGQKKRDDK